MIPAKIYTIKITDSALSYTHGVFRKIQEVCVSGRFTEDLFFNSEGFMFMSLPEETKYRLETAENITDIEVDEKMILDIFKCIQSHNKSKEDIMDFFIDRRNQSHSDSLFFPSK